MSVGGVIGGAIGFFVGGPGGVALGYSLGSGVESLLNPEQIEGPRLDDLRVQMSSYGANVPFEWGVNRHAGTVIWPKIIELKETSQTESAKGGPETTTYSYSCSLAVLLCEGPIKGVTRIWANKKIVYDVTVANTGPNKDPALRGVRFYLGTETQQVDPLIEATDGPSPAYRGHAYVVFEDFDLTDFANRPPQFEFEVITEGAAAPDAPPVRFGSFIQSFNGTGASVLDPDSGYLWVVNGGNAATTAQTGGALDGPCINVWNLATKQLVKVISHGKDSGLFGTTPLTHRAYGDLAYNPSRRSVFAGSAASAATSAHAWYEFSTATLSQVKIGDAAQGIGYGAGIPSGVAYVSPVLMLSLKAGFFGGNVTYFHPDSGPYANLTSTRTYGMGGRAIPLADSRVALATANGLLIVTPSGFESIFYEGAPIFPGANDSNYNDASLALDAVRNRLLWSVGGKIVALDVSDPSGVYVAPRTVLTLPAGSIFTAIASDPRNGMYYAIGQGSGYIIDGASLTLDRTIPTTGIDAPTDITISPVPGEIIITGFDGVWSMQIDTALAPAKIPLSLIVGDLCKRAGMTAADIDVAQLTDLVDGYIVPRQMSARAAVEPLQQAYYFDAVESDDKLKFVKRGINAPVLISMESRAARDFGSDLPDSLAIVRAQDMELPVQCDVEFADVDADHLIGNQYDRRITKDTKQRINLPLPIVMGAAKAKEVAIVTLYAAWLNETYKFTTTREYAHLEPTDLVTLPTTAASYTARLLTKREQPGGVIEWEARKEGVVVYTQSGTGAAPSNYVKQAIYSPTPTKLELLDIPMLRDTDNDAGFYVAMG